MLSALDMREIAKEPPPPPTTAPPLPPLPPPAHADRTRTSARARWTNNVHQHPAAASSAATLPLERRSRSARRGQCAQWSVCWCVVFPESGEIFKEKGIKMKTTCPAASSGASARRRGTRLARHIQAHTHTPTQRTLCKQEK